MADVYLLIVVMLRAGGRLCFDIFVVYVIFAPLSGVLLRLQSLLQVGALGCGRICCRKFIERFLSSRLYGGLFSPCL